MSSELFMISAPIVSTSVSGGASSLKAATISTCWSHEDLNQYFTKSITVVQPNKKSLDTNSIHERDMYARVNLNKVPITLDTNNLTRNRVSSISLNTPPSNILPAELTPIIEKENKRAKAKRMLKELLSKKPFKTEKKPVVKKTSMIIKFIVTCAALNILGFVTFAAIVTFALPNLFMHPAAYVSVSAKQHLLHEDATLYRKLVHSAHIPETLMTFPDNTITSNTDDNGESFNRKSGLKIDVSMFNLLKKEEKKEDHHDVHPSFANLDHAPLMKGNHRDRLVDYIEQLPHKNDPLIDFGLNYKNITFTSLYEKKKLLRGWYVEASDKNSNKAVVIVHGAFYDRRDVVEHLPYIHKLGVHVLLFDMLNHGVSDGDEGCSLSFREWMGVMSAVDYLEGIIPNVEVVAFGSSTGATSSIVAASQDARIKGIIAENPFAERTLQIKDVLESALYKNGWSHQLPSLFGSVIENYGKYIPEAVIRSVSILVNWRMCDFSVNSYHATDAMKEMSKPLLLIHSKTDKVVDFKHSQILHSLATGPIDYWVVEDAPHSCIHRHLKEEFEAKVVTFLQKHLLKQ